jgi:4,5-dihydroxyphthalate decarboxylase
MAGKLKLTVACGDYEIVRALKEGAVEADGLELVMLTGMGPRERHWRMARRAEFDVCEANVGAYFMERDQGAGPASEAGGQRGNSTVRAPLTAIPVFLHRRFRHGFLFVNAAAGIRAPKDLIGKTVGGTNFQPASNIWMRGILQEEYGLPHRQVTWMVERSEDVAFTPPKDLRIEMIAPGKKLDLMLAEGEIPAMLSPELPRLFRAGDKRIVRLFPDYKEIELAYFRRTGIFPIMHVTTIKQEIVDKFPWVPTNLTKAFEAAKAIAYQRIANPRVVPLAWVRTALEEQEELLGRDPWAYGLTPANRKNLETVLRYTFEQGMISKMLPLDALFADTDLGDAGGSDGI